MLYVELTPADYHPAPPPDSVRRSYGIAIVGCGSIARRAHLPAYRDSGYRVVAACDIVEEHARQAAAEFDIPFWTTRLGRVLERPDVDVVDVAVPASERLPLVQQAAAAGKHILSQKPFALNLPDAKRMVEICREAGVTLMVNQQARWRPVNRALKVLLERGVLGHLYSVLHINRTFEDVPGSWYVTLPNFNIIDHGIHHIDLSRYFTGRTPRRVKATTTMVPGQVAVTPMIYTVLCEYEPEAQLMTTLHLNNIVKTHAMHYYEWFLDGTEGSVSASRNELVFSPKDNPNQRQVFAIQERGYPEAFGASMGEMLQSLTEGREPATSGLDNLNTIRIACAAIESSNTGLAVELLD